MMQYPECSSTHMRKNGCRRGKQNHICVTCCRQFVDHHTTPGYSDDVKQLCLKMYINGMGFPGIERVTDVHHTPVITWVKHVGVKLPNTYELS
jgi:transposase-like protein